MSQMIYQFSQVPLYSLSIDVVLTLSDPNTIYDEIFFSV